MQYMIGNYNIMKTKVCTKCGIEKELKEFFKNKKMKDDYLSTCKLCCKKKPLNI